MSHSLQQHTHSANLAPFSHDTPASSNTSHSSPHTSPFPSTAASSTTPASSFDLPFGVAPTSSYSQGPSLSQSHHQNHPRSPNFAAMGPNSYLSSSYSDASSHHYSALTPPQLVTLSRPLAAGSSSSAPSSNPSSSSPRFQPYSRPQPPQRSLSSTSPASGSGNLGSMPPPSLPPTFSHQPVPPPQSQSQPQPQHPSPGSLHSQFYPTLPLSRSVNDTTPPGPGGGAGAPPLDSSAPFSAGYPGVMYGNLPIPPIPDAYMSMPVALPNWERAMHEPVVGPDDYAQAIDIYSHIYNALPYLVPTSQPAPSQPQPGPIPQGMTASPLAYDSLIGLASDGHSIITGQGQASPDAAGGAGGVGYGGAAGSASDGGSGAGAGAGAAGKKSGSGSKKGSSEGAPNKCLGCGATKTPEWRRGPMGPRTLCNACGLVHMKLQRKKRKAEEKEKAAAAAAAESGSAAA
ncbi:hypothetical protein IAT38_001222 [Cryptococcus sp. DSM 104549]